MAAALLQRLLAAASCYGESIIGEAESVIAVSDDEDGGLQAPVPDCASVHVCLCNMHVGRCREHSGTGLHRIQFPQGCVRPAQCQTYDCDVMLCAKFTSGQGQYERKRGPVRAQTGGATVDLMINPDHMCIALAMVRWAAHHNNMW